VRLIIRHAEDSLEAQGAGAGGEKEVLSHGCYLSTNIVDTV